MARLTSQDCFKEIIGTPYDLLDCWGVAINFYKLVYDYDLPQYYASAPNNTSVSNQLILSNMDDFSETNNPEFGDLVLINLLGMPSHVAVYLSSKKMLHTSRVTGCMIDNIKRWEKKIVGYYKVER